MEQLPRPKMGQDGGGDGGGGGGSVGRRTRAAE